MLKVKRGSNEEIPLIQGKEQRLSFAGTAMKRYRMPKVRETQDHSYTAFGSYQKQLKCFFVQCDTCLQQEGTM
ncbi:hypothetical protein MG293_000806 [Ovis ammon polii]|uniref:Uncharacterized protein n=1 Tax=Ovis ammon polii TaxID=230172 RepID=A0AAD4UNJ4_OVIAM|nr:hypothetical protein MG293_000806 [Ovis ammon polii]